MNKNRMGYVNIKDFEDRIRKSMEIIGSHSFEIKDRIKLTTNIYEKGAYIIDDNGNKWVVNKEPKIDKETMMTTYYLTKE